MSSIGGEYLIFSLVFSLHNQSQLFPLLLRPFCLCDTHSFFFYYSSNNTHLTHYLLLCFPGCANRRRCPVMGAQRAWANFFTQSVVIYLVLLWNKISESPWIVGLMLASPSSASPWPCSCYWLLSTGLCCYLLITKANEPIGVSSWIADGDPSVLHVYSFLRYKEEQLFRSFLLACWHLGFVYK